MVRIVFTAARFAAIVCVSACVITAGAAFAATQSKGLKLDPMLEQAIAGTARPAPPPEPYGPSVPPPREEVIWNEPPPPPPVVIAEEPSRRAPFRWPDEPGYMINGMMFYPALMIKQGYTDNLFTNDIGGNSDIITHVMPSLRIDIPDIRHDVTFETMYEFRKHIDNTEEDQHNFHASLDGALRAVDGLTFPFGFVWKYLHEEREDDLTAQRADEPIRRDDLAIRGGVSFKKGSFGVDVIGHYEKQRFEDDFSTLNNADVIRRDADRDFTTFEFNTSFDLDPQNTLMLVGTIGDRDYERANFQGGGFNGPRRNSDIFTGSLGWHFTYDDFYGHIRAGVEDFNYDDSAIQDMREITADLEIEHRLTDRTLINFQAGRGIFEDDEVFEPIVRSHFGTYIDHRAWDNVLLAFGTDYEFLEFTDSARDDETWDFRVLADYFFNDFLAFGAEYMYTVRDSEQDLLDFNRNVFLLRARGRL